MALAMALMLRHLITIVAATLAGVFQSGRCFDAGRSSCRADAGSAGAMVAVRAGSETQISARWAGVVRWQPPMPRSAASLPDPHDDEIEAFATAMGGQGIVAKNCISHAFHSPMMRDVIGLVHR